MWLQTHLEVFDQIYPMTLTPLNIKNKIRFGRTQLNEYIFVEALTEFNCEQTKDRDVA